MLGAGFQGRTGGQRQPGGCWSCGFFLRCSAVAGFQERVAQLLELGMLGVQRFEINVRLGGRRNAGEDRVRVGEGAALVVEAAERAGIDPAAARLAGVFQDGGRESDFG